MKPLGPYDVIKEVPEYIVSVVNDLLKEKFYENEIRINTKRIWEKAEEYSKGYISYTSTIKDIENLYKSIGWSVKTETVGHETVWDSHGPSISSTNIMIFTRKQDGDFKNKHLRG